MKYYLISGEASGDLHGAHLIKALKKLDAQCEFRAWGGDLMNEAGANIVKHYKELAVSTVRTLRTCHTYDTTVKGHI